MYIATETSIIQNYLKRCYDVHTKLHCIVYNNCSTEPQRHKNDSDVVSSMNVTLDAIPGQFVPQLICLGSVTQMQAYYIILVSIMN